MDNILTESLAQTYSAHRQGLFSLALTITGCRQQAEDAVHTAFERLCTSRPTVDGDLKTYVFAAVRNAAIDLRRVGQRGKRIQESIFNGYAPVPTVSGSPPDELLTAERDQILRHAVSELKDDDREIVILKAFAGLTFEHIAEVLEMPAKTIATRYRRALTTLEKRLRGQL